MLSTDKTKRAQIFVCIAIVLMLISMIGASLIQTSGGRVKVDEVNWVDTDGIRKTALVLVGEFLGGAYERSRLYDPGFSHGYREAKP